MSPAEMHIASFLGMHLPRRLAALLTVGFIAFLFRRDLREKPNVSGAFWISLLWFVVTCSRGLSQWLNIFGLHVTGAVSVEEGSPLDAWFYLALIAAGLCVLTKRQISFVEIARDNGWIIAFLVYSFISIAWSDFPLVSFKRWIKVLGPPIMALIVLTEPDFEEALRRLMKLCAYIVVPVSILFIKYYPEWGRTYDQWTGFQMTNGIAQGKNLLGADCLVLGFFFFWHLLQVWRTKRSRERRNELWLIAGFLFGICWILRLAHSATSSIALCVGILTVVFVGLRSINKKAIGMYMSAALILIIAAELGFGISGRVSEALGRSSDLSGRTQLWKALLKCGTNPVFGTGFESFWLGDRMERFAEMFKWHPNEAHNGYLEIYLTLGLIGLFILAGIFIQTFRKIRFELFRNFEWGRYQLGFFVAAVLCNWTEAVVRTFHPIWFVFYIVAITYPRSRLTTAQQSQSVARSEERGEFAYAEGEP